MRPGQQNNNKGGGGGGMRNRNRNRKGPNPLQRSYESNGGDVKIRGTALHVAEKYVQLARDAQSSGDRVASENYLQHAEHYYRIVAAAQAQMPQPQQFYRNDEDGDDEEERDGGAMMGGMNAMGYPSANGGNNQGGNGYRDNSYQGNRPPMNQGGGQPNYGVPDQQPPMNGSPVAGPEGQEQPPFEGGFQPGDNRSGEQRADDSRGQGGGYGQGSGNPNFRHRRRRPYRDQYSGGERPMNDAANPPGNAGGGEPQGDE